MQLYVIHVEGYAAVCIHNRWYAAVFFTLGDMQLYVIHVEGYAAACIHNRWYVAVYVIHAREYVQLYMLS